MMKKTILILILTMTCVSGVFARGKGRKLSLSDIKTELQDEEVTLSFNMEIDAKGMKDGRTRIYVPVITDGEYKVSFPAVVVRDRRADIAWERHEWIGGGKARLDTQYQIKGSDSFSYLGTVEFQPWMSGARVKIESATESCGEISGKMFQITDNVLAGRMPVALPELDDEEFEMPDIVLTVPERIAVALPFVLPASDFDPEEPIKFYDDERDNTLTVYYNVSRYDIEPDYADNDQTLTNLLASIDIIEKNPGSKVQHVVVAGFASPEGPYEVNDRLAWERAVSVKEYVMKNTNMNGDEIKLYNGSADWRGLRALIEQDRFVPDKQQILDIIDNNPIWNVRTNTGRLTLMRNLNGGKAYRYISENIFPKLRNGAFIRVYFENVD